MSRTTTDCISTPISWLRLEDYAMGEGEGAGRAEIATHLGACKACSECFARIEEGASMDLVPLPAARAPTRSRPRGRTLVVSIGSGLALAAAAILAIGRWSRVDEDALEKAARTKGDAFAFTLVRDDQARFADGAGVFRSGDRFKALVTCPPGARLHFDLVVVDEAGASFPLEPTTNLACGNDVPLDGAFLLTGPAPLHVCLVWSETPLSRTTLATLSPTTLASQGACKSLTPAR